MFFTRGSNTEMTLANRSVDPIKTSPSITKLSTAEPSTTSSPGTTTTTSSSPLEKFKNLYHPLYTAAYFEYYTSLGYKICQMGVNKGSFVNLERPKEPTCENAFKSVLDESHKTVAWPPPRQMPTELRDRYLLGGPGRPGRLLLREPL